MSEAREGVRLGDGLGVPAVAWALAVVAVDATQVVDHPPDSPRRLLLPLIGLAVLFVLARGRRRALGWNARPVGGLGRALPLVAATALLTGLLAWWSGAEGPAVDRGAWLRVGVLAAPWVEEGVCRLVLVPAVCGRAGRTAAVLASGLAFAGLHQLTGTLDPVNAAAGFLLAILFVATECFWVPVVVHAAGNGLWLVLP